MGRDVTVVGYEKKEGKKELKKHAATIHCSNTLSLLQRKITNALLYHAYKELLLKEEHEITVKQLCRLIGYQGNNHAAIKEALRGLISTVVEWNLIDDKTGAENWTASSMLASVCLDGPLCHYAYSPRMKQLLHSPSMFGKIDLVIQSRFRSSYGLALYENCIRYRGLPHTKWFEMELFKKLMGVPSGKYDIFRDFKRRVLDKAVDEVNTYSDLIVAADFIREGRKVVKVRFKLKERAKKTRLGTTQAAKRLTVKGDDEGLKAVLLQEFHLSEEQIEELLTAYDSQFVQDKVTLIKKSKPFREGKIDNLAAYLFSAIKRNYQQPKSRQEPVAESQEVKLERELAEIQRQVEETLFAYRMYREKAIDEVIQALPIYQKNDFMRQFYQFAEPVVQTILQLQRNKYSRNNIHESPQIKALMRKFAVREIDLLALPSFEEFLVQQAEDKIEAWQKLKSYDPDHPLLRFSE
ncbi:MAG: RepB family plasmid replication initiator protein [Gammaproteobacteria bacterium]|nr:MAG: RepB family plasmid replication initiator protein [Gammaproteobacteria bacterium]